MSLTLQKESPSDSDLFRGESHEKVASRMADIIRTSDTNILGLEGELGSGKSTIINFLKDKLSGEFTFIDFDAERYHYGNTKKALVEIIHQGISKKNGVNKESLNKFKDQALGNIVEYDKKINSRISWWTVLFILFSLLSVQMIRYILVDLNSYLTKKDSVSEWVFFVELVGLISPGLLLFLLAACRKWGKFSDGRDIATVGDLFKRNSVDRISETWLINREIGTIELMEALSGFTSRGTLPNDARFILIIDNLDRISAEKVKELWSDMELIAGTTHEQFRIIVPYSARQVASSLSVEGHSGREFIAKRIPVTFSVPPLITAGWQDAFRKMWQETVHDSDPSSCLEAIQLLERWRPVEYPRITPRLLKKFVNDIHILDLTVPTGEPIRHVLIAVYILVVRYSDHDIRSLLRAHQEEENTAPPPDDFSEKLRATYAQLSRIFSNDTLRWSEFLMSVHYQSAPELARSELIDTPLMDAIKNQDHVALESIVSLWGFSHAWQRCIGRMSISDWLETAVKLSAEALQNVQPQINMAFNILNTNYALNGREPFRRALSEALLELKRLSYVEQEPFMERQCDFLVEEINRLQNNPENDESYVINLLQEADLYSAIYEKNLFESIPSELSGYFYVQFLLEHQGSYPHLDIASLKLNEREQEVMLRTVLEATDGDIFHLGVSRFFGLYSKVVESIIDNKENNLPEPVTKAMNDLRQHIVIAEIDAFRKTIFSQEWYNTNHIPHYAYQGSIKTAHPEEFAAQMVAHMVATSTFNNIELHAKDYIDSEVYTAHLASYFCYMKSFDTVMHALADDNVAPYVAGAIGHIFRNEKIQWMPTLAYIKEYYPLLKMHVPDINYLAPLSVREEGLLKHLNVDVLEDISDKFLDDLFVVDVLQKTRDKLYLLSQTCFEDETNLYTAFNVIGENKDKILKNMAATGNRVHMKTGTHFFADWYRNTDASELGKGENIRFLWSLLVEEQRKDILAQLHDVLLEIQIRPDNRIKIIHDFYDVIEFKEPDGKGSRRSIAALFSLAMQDDVLRKWLDAQVFLFGNWPTEESQMACQSILENQDSFPKICASSRFIKNRVGDGVL
ncbi:P-loop NTPase fold protein [Dickeya oryzae]|uniref:P-loop NTPase fold protein n=1 Tax=Dickeya oryzae TaxID=1240404 RepID=UPI001AEC800D|nr:P-loop NTPase fold protein [Dickeya oryzae]MBP2847950.1 hypothetical protein [Dickeya oryzae]